MAEVTIGSHKWRKRTRDWSAVCDNTLKLNRSQGMVGNPSRLNSFGVCSPDCEICVTPVAGPSISVTNCACDTLPRSVDIKLNGGFSHPTIDYSDYNRNYQLTYGAQVIRPVLPGATDDGCRHYVRLGVYIGELGALSMNYIVRRFTGGFGNPGGFVDSNAGPVLWRVMVEYNRSRRITVTFHMYGSKFYFPTWQNPNPQLDGFSTFSAFMPSGKTCFDEFTLPFVGDFTLPGGANPSDSVAVLMRNITKPASITIKPTPI